MKTGLIRKMSAPQGLEVEIRSFGKNEYAKGATGVKTGLLWKISVLKGLKVKVGHFE